MNYQFGKGRQTNAFQVLMKEPKMRRATEHYISVQMKYDTIQLKGQDGRYIDDNGLMDLNDGIGAKIWIRKRPYDDTVVIEKSIFY